jgi:large subunit ribosomal protein L32
LTPLDLADIIIKHAFYKARFYDYCEEVLGMAVPKRKTSKARRDKRRSSVWKIAAPTLVTCPQCGQFMVPHKACGNCGYYKGREVINKEA